MTGESHPSRDREPAPETPLDRDSSQEANMQHGIPEERQGGGLSGMQVQAAVFPALTLSSLETSTLLHDARNMLGALQLYSDLLEEPGVLALPHRHYACELRLIGSACRRLVERLALISPELSVREFSIPELSFQELSAPQPSPSAIAAEPVQSLAAELEINHSLLAALAGPAIQVNLTLHGGHLPIAMAREDLTRVLVNLTRNAAQAMPSGGSLEIDLEETAQALVLTVSDTGPGIPEASLEAVFSPGYTTGPPPPADTALQSQPLRSQDNRPLIHRGLGLAIVRSIVSAAGGSVRAAQRIGPSIQGAMIVLEFPLPAAAHPVMQHESAEDCPTASVSHPPL
jgi:signal transduction histidine kinase